MASNEISAPVSSLVGKLAQLYIVRGFSGLSTVDEAPGFS